MVYTIRVQNNFCNVAVSATCCLFCWCMALPAFDFHFRPSASAVNRSPVSSWHLLCWLQKFVGWDIASGSATTVPFSFRAVTFSREYWIPLIGWTRLVAILSQFTVGLLRTRDRCKGMLSNSSSNRRISWSTRRTHKDEAVTPAVVSARNLKWLVMPYEHTHSHMIQNWMLIPAAFSRLAPRRTPEPVKRQCACCFKQVAIQFVLARGLSILSVDESGWRTSRSEPAVPREGNFCCVGKNERN